jgi:hypothetical protein
MQIPMNIAPRGCDSWALKATHTSKLTTFHHKCARWLANVEMGPQIRTYRNERNPQTPRRPSYLFQPTGTRCQERQSRRILGTSEDAVVVVLVEVLDYDASSAL